MRAISPPASRRPPRARRRARPATSSPASGSSSQHDVGSLSRAATASTDSASRRGRSVPRHAPALIEVDHDLHRRPDGVPHGLDRGEAVLDSPAVDPHLQRAETLLPERECRLGTRRGAAAVTRRRVRGEAVQRAPQELRNRDAGRLAGQVPERRLERPVAACVEGDRLQHADVVPDVERVAADEEVDVALEPVHRVARADAREALVGVDEDERRLEGVPGLWDPRQARTEGRAGGAGAGGGRP